jgi:hypothetical protein
MGKEANIKRVLTYLVCFAVSFFLYGVFHELIGHGLTAILLGGSIDSIHLFCFKVFPNFEWSGIPGGVGIDNLEEGKLLDIVIIVGPISTWVVSLLAVIVLWVRRPAGLLRVILVCLSLWCYDLLGEALLVWGIPKYLFFHSESPFHYEAAVRLGIQDPLFHIFSIGTSICILAGVMLRLIRNNKRQKTVNQEVI